MFTHILCQLKKRTLSDWRHLRSQGRGLGAKFFLSFSFFSFSFFLKDLRSLIGITAGYTMEMKLVEQHASKFSDFLFEFLKLYYMSTLWLSSDTLEEGIGSHDRWL